jgi:protein TonB
MDDVDITSEVDVTEQVKAPPEPPKAVEKKVEEEEQYFEVVEDQPEIIGGLDAIKANLVYPDLAIRAGVEGTVSVLAWVDRNGNVTRAEILRGIGGGCDEAAIDAVKKVKFKPGMQRGKPVNVKVSVPVRFRLK